MYRSSRAHRWNDSNLVARLDHIASVFFEVDILQIDGEGRAVEHLVPNSRILLLEGVVKMGELEWCRECFFLFLCDGVGGGEVEDPE